jgi:hypothetical protein
MAAFMSHVFGEFIVKDCAATTQSSISLANICSRLLFKPFETFGGIFGCSFQPFRNVRKVYTAVLLFACFRRLASTVVNFFNPDSATACALSGGQ